MKILQNNNDRTIFINSETNFGTDLGWEENFQEFEHETLKSIINPTENFETVRYIHAEYTSELGIEQHDLWQEFYFADSSGFHIGGLNYERVGLSAENNSKLLRTENTSFFRLEFYKVPVGETPNSKNRKLVFTKQLPIPMGEQIVYTPIKQKVYVPVFSGSNYRNNENMFLYWFQDDTVLEGTVLSGNTFYMAAKFYNTIDGTNIAFLNKDKDIFHSVVETEDMYRKMVINRSDYSYVIYTGITEDHRGGESSSNTPLKWYAGSASSSSLDPFVPPPRVSCGLDTNPWPSIGQACIGSPSITVYLESGFSVPEVGVTVYLTSTGASTFTGNSTSYYNIIPSSSYAVRIDPNGVILSVNNC